MGADEVAQDGSGRDALLAAHERLLKTPGYQFEFPPPEPETPPPGWLEDLLRALGGFGPAFEIIFWIGLAAAVGALLWFLLGEVIAARWPTLFKTKPLVLQSEWRPTEAQARVLLADADRLAADGLFAEAARLLLHRSVEDIRERRPRLIRPALTSRDIGVHPDLPVGARDAFVASPGSWSGQSSLPGP